MNGILVLGALHYDVVVDAPRLPEVDETLPGTAVDYRFGGKGGNQAVAAARMGASVAMAGRVGRDAAAGVIRSVLEASGVDQRLVEDTNAATGMSVAVSLPSGEYGAVIVSGANLRNTGAIDWAKPPATVILQNEIPDAANLELVRRLPTKTRLIVNAAPARPIPSELARRTDVLIVNQLEAEELTRKNKPMEAARAFAAQVRGAVVVTMGARGLIAIDGEEARLFPAHKVEVVSAHGAGDMFTGALAARLTDGDFLLDALDFAMAAAALFVSMPVAEREKVSKAAVEAFLAR
jgi:ribokinase